MSMACGQLQEGPGPFDALWSGSEQLPHTISILEILGFEG